MILSSMRKKIMYVYTYYVYDWCSPILSVYIFLCFMYTYVSSMYHSDSFVYLVHFIPTVPLLF